MPTAAGLRPCLFLASPLALASAIALGAGVGVRPDLPTLTGLESGPHAVGFSLLRLRDTSRPWPSPDDPQGVRGRPVQIGVWYASAATGSRPLTIGDYVRADQVEPQRSRSASAARDDVETALGRPLSAEQWQRVLGTRGLASADPPPLPGRRGLVLFETSLRGRTYWGLPLVEVLASHGYVVAHLASAGQGADKPLAFDLEGVLAQVGDMERALVALADRRDVDASRVALVGWSVGGVSQALLRQRHPGRFRAALSLDSGTAYAYGSGLLQRAGGLDSAALAMPFLQVDAARADSPVPRDDSFFRSHRRAPALRLEVSELRHADLALPSVLGRWVARDAGADPPAGLSALAKSVRLFLDAHVAGEESAGRRLSRVLAGPGFTGARLLERHEPVMVPSDGWSLAGDLVVPGPGPLPAVLLLNKAGGDRAAYATLADRLAGSGIASLRLDLRAHGGSINLGRFDPPRNLELLEGSDRDVNAALARLRSEPGVDGTRLAVVGASYSGEAMMQAAQQAGFAAAYVGLSPGSLSDASIDAIDAHQLHFLLVVARHERYLKEVAAALRERSRTAEFLELAGTEHASDLLSAHPDLADRLVTWLRSRLASDQPARGPAAGP